MTSPNLDILPEQVREILAGLIADISQQIEKHSALVPELDTAALGEGFTHHAASISRGFLRMHTAELRRMRLLREGLEAIAHDVALFENQDRNGARSVEAIK